MLNDTTLATLEASLRGELIQRNEPGYEEARQMYNGMIDLREFPDGRGRGAHPGDLWRQLRPLVAIKRQYDLTHCFRVNQNIRPV